jgi:hypothetical protein
MTRLSQDPRAYAEHTLSVSTLTEDDAIRLLGHRSTPTAE